jgi:hypothetical protein
MFGCSSRDLDAAPPSDMTDESLAVVTLGCAAAVGACWSAGYSRAKGLQRL